MSLEKLVPFLSVSVKQALLGHGVLSILKETFKTSESDTIPSTIINDAVLTQCCYKLVQERRYREELVNVLSPNQIEALGFSTYTKAISKLCSNPEKFCQSLNISKSFLLKSAPPNYPPSESIVCEYGESLKSSGYLHPYQKRVKSSLIQALLKSTGTRHLTIMPTGAGKTTTALEVATDLLRANIVFGDNPLFNLTWIVDSPTLAEQALQTLKELWTLKGDSSIDTHRYYSPYYSNCESNVPSATFATFSLVTARIDSPEVQRLLSKTSLLVIDETHSANAPTYREVLDAFMNANPQGQVIGLTATPYRPDDERFNSVRTLFNNHISICDESMNAVSSPIEFLTKSGFLAQLDFHKFGDSETNDYQNLHFHVLDTCHTILEHKENCIIFCKSYAHAIALNLFLTKNQIITGLIIGDTPPSLRSEILQRLADTSDDLNIVVNYDLLSKGIDVKGLKSIMILNTISNESTALQVIGRALRGEKNGGNKTNRIYLTTENFNKLSELQILEQHTLNHA